MVDREGEMVDGEEEIVDREEEMVSIPISSQHEGC
jgi:hypothetical protein